MQAISSNDISIDFGGVQPAKAPLGAATITKPEAIAAEQIVEKHIQADVLAEGDLVQNKVEGACVPQGDAAKSQAVAAKEPTFPVQVNFYFWLDDFLHLCAEGQYSEAKDSLDYMREHPETARQPRWEVDDKSDTSDTDDNVTSCNIEQKGGSEPEDQEDAERVRRCLAAYASAVSTYIRQLRQTAAAKLPNTSSEAGAWEIQTLPDRGRTVVATQRIAAGEEIISERPIALLQYEASARYCPQCLRAIPQTSCSHEAFTGPAVALAAKGEDGSPVHSMQNAVPNVPASNPASQEEDNQAQLSGAGCTSLHAVLTAETAAAGEQPGTSIDNPALLAVKEGVPATASTPNKGEELTSPIGSAKPSAAKGFDSAVSFLDTGSQPKSPEETAGSSPSAEVARATDACPDIEQSMACTCGVVFCSKACKEQALRGHHSLLCRTLLAPEQLEAYDAIDDLSEKIGNRSLLLAVHVTAEILAEVSLLSAADQQSSFSSIFQRYVGSFHGAPWESLIEDQELISQRVQCVEELARLSRQLLQPICDRLHDTKTLSELLLSPDALSRCIGMLELVCVKASVLKPLSLREEGKPGIADDAATDREKADAFQQVSAKNRTAEKLIFASAMVEFVSFCNHSCIPNIEVDFRHEDERPGLWCVVTSTRTIAAGEELNMQYMPVVATPFAKRQEKLQDNWLFKCECVRCTAEEIFSEEDAKWFSAGWKAFAPDDDSAGDESESASDIGDGVLEAVEDAPC